LRRLVVNVEVRGHAGEAGAVLFMHGLELRWGDCAEVADQIDHFRRGADRQVPGADRWCCGRRGRP